MSNATLMKSPRGRSGTLTLALLLGMTGLAGAAEWPLLDQLGPDPNSIAGRGVWASQRFETSFAQYDIGVLDDFVVPPPGAQLATVEAVLGFWGGTGNFVNIQSYAVEVYSSVAAAARNLRGDVASFETATYANLVQPWGAGGYRQGKVTLDVAPGQMVLQPGRYWLAVIPRMVFSPQGQCGVSGSWLGDLNAAQANPGGAFGFPNGYQYITPPENAAFRISAVPEPGALALLVLAALLLGRRLR